MTVAQRKAFAARLRKYGITALDFRTAWTNQDGRCPICGKKLDRKKPSGCQIEHCHRTGKFRGLVDWYCNMKVIAPIERAGKARALAAFRYLWGDL